MKHLKHFIFFFLIIFFLSEGEIYSQGKSPAVITESNNISPTGVPNSDLNFGNESNEIKELARQITEAKKSGNAERVQYCQNKLDALTGASKVDCQNLQYTIGSNEKTDVLNYNTVATGNISSASVALDRTNGNIYAVTVYGFTPPTVSIFKSVNNGLSFSLLFTFTPNLPTGYYCTANQLDLEVVGRGDFSYLYGVMQVWKDSTKGIYFKIRNDGNFFSSSVFASTNTAFAPYNVPIIRPRITSDNAAFLVAPFVYITYTVDSLRGTGNKWMKTKVIRITNPYDSIPTLVNLNPPGSFNGAYFYNAPNQPDSAFMQTDICCIGTGDSNFVVTTSVMRGATTFSGTNFYMTTSAASGSTIASSNSVNDTKLLDIPRIASPGFGTRDVMMGAIRLYGGGDWDPYYYKSNTINRNFGNFTSSGFVDNSTDTTVGMDLAARYRSFDNYLFAINNKKKRSGGAAIYGVILGNLYSSGVFAGLYQANPPSFPVQYGGNFPSATFRSVNNDSCFIGYGGACGSGNPFCNYGVTGGCSGAFIGIENSSLMVKGFQLSQNYPNPFNPSTKIFFTVLKNSFVNIKVFDVLGREVAELVNEVVTAGEHNVTFNGETFQSGIYYYKMEAGDFSETKKMILVK